MDSFDISHDISLKLLNGTKCQLDSSWNYPDITSPFSRMYLIISGKGNILINNQRVDLIPGNLYLIPSYITCSYYCDSYLEKYYIHFTNSFTNGLNIFDLYPVAFSVKAQKRDFELFDRLLAINPDIGLKVADPEIYHKKKWVNKNPTQNSLSNYLESTGILYNLLSRFFSLGEKNTEPVKYAIGNLKKALVHIDQNISEKIAVSDLADLVCLSDDHFTRSFKKMVGITPNRYLNMKRIEKAQLLLITTNLSIKEIVEKTGFNSVSFFNRNFKKFTGNTPMEYKNMQLEII